MSVAEQNFAEELAERCRKVGFNVVRTRDGYRVEGPDGMTAGWHITPSDNRWRRKCLAALNRMGLNSREQKVGIHEERKRKAVLAADRDANDAKTKATIAKAQKAAVALRRVAGEYATFDETEAAWILRKHSAPASRAYLVTPSLAAKMLKRNVDNRPRRERHMKALRTAMREGSFVFTHQGVAFDTDGVFFDGQHRCQAIVDTDVAQMLWVFVGVDTRAVHFVDQHARRSGSDALTMGDNRVANATAVAALIRFVYGYDHAEPTMWAHVAVDNERTTKEFEANGEDYIWAVKNARSARQAWPGYTATPIGGLLYILKRRGASLHDIDDFLSKFKTGEDLSSGHPILLLRRQANKYDDMQGHAVRPKIQFGEWVIAWNAYAQGRKLLVFNHRLDDPIPPIAVRE